MRAIHISVGKHYVAKVSGRIVTVRVDAIRETFPHNRPNGANVYDVTNLDTGRKTTFRSARRFRNFAGPFLGKAALSRRDAQTDGAEDMAEQAASETILPNDERE